jgi:hypothetical protein
MAGTLGSVLNPMLDRNTELSSEMSTRFTELAVDLGSFFNAADNDVLEALRAGLTGSSEPLQRFGVVMNEAALKAYAQEQGIRKNVSAMSTAEKVQLKYNFILEKTAAAHGDAAKTGLGWANAVKGLQGAVKDLLTRFALAFLPMAEKIVNIMSNMIRNFNDAAKNSRIFEAAIITLGTVAVAWAGRMAIAYRAVLAPILKLALILTIVALAIEDFLVFLEGGDSLIGRFIDSIWGPGSATAAVEAFKLIWEDLSKLWTNDVIPTIKLLAKAFMIFLDDTYEAFLELEKIIEENQELIDAFNASLASLGQFFFGIKQQRVVLPTKEKIIYGPQPQTRLPAQNTWDMSQQTTIHISGDATPETVDKMTRAQVDKTNREKRLQAALVQRGQS